MNLVDGTRSSSYHFTFNIVTKMKIRNIVDLVDVK